MSILRFDPFRDVDRLTEQLLGAPAGTRRAPRVMPMDLYRSGDHFVVKADLPGADPGSIDVDVDNGIMTIRAQRSGMSDESAEWIASERSTGAYQRQVSLGDGIDTGAIHASYDDGVLTITVPVAEKAKARKIEIRVGERGEVVAADVQADA